MIRVFITFALLVFIVFTTVSAVAEVKCDGLIATIIGTAGDDTLNGTSGPDVIHGLGGNDTINGLDGNDVICGGRGRDTLNGGNGDDLLSGNRGSDTLNGGDGIDTLKGGRGRNDVCEEVLGRDTASNCEIILAGAGGNCDFIPENFEGNAALKTHDGCATLADNFDCEDFVWEEGKGEPGIGTCEVTGCVDCLCSATSKAPITITGAGAAEVCAVTAGLSSCLNAFYQSDTQRCFLIDCIQELPCGPFPP